MAHLKGGTFYKPEFTISYMILNISLLFVLSTFRTPFPYISAVFSMHLELLFYRFISTFCIGRTVYGPIIAVLFVKINLIMVNCLSAAIIIIIAFKFYLVQ
jgi:hypothetical protein